jgi:hypothetical protein
MEPTPPKSSPPPEKEKFGDPSPHVDPLDADSDIVDYEDLLDVARRKHLKLAANVAEALSNGEAYVRERLGLPDPREDRTSPRAPGPGDALFELGRLHLEYLDKLADLTKEIGADAHRYLEGLFARAGRSAGAPARLAVDVFEPADGATYEPSRPRLSFEVQNDWKAGATIDFQAGRFVDLETGTPVAEERVTLLRVKAEGATRDVALGGRVRATVEIQARRTHLRLHHIYKAPIRVLVDGVLRQTIEVVVRALPKPAIPTLELTWDGNRFSPKDRVFPVSNDTKWAGTFVAKVDGQPVTLKKDGSCEAVSLLDVASGQPAGCQVVLRLTREQERDRQNGNEKDIPRDALWTVTPAGTVEPGQVCERDIALHFSPDPPGREELLARIRVRVQFPLPAGAGGRGSKEAP